MFSTTQVIINLAKRLEESTQTKERNYCIMGRLHLAGIPVARFKEMGLRSIKPI